MPRKMAKILGPAKQTPTEKQPLRVVAYCRVSTRHEEQYHSLEAQIPTTQIISSAIQTGDSLRCILTLLLVPALPTAPAIRSS